MTDWLEGPGRLTNNDVAYRNDEENLRSDTVIPLKEPTASGLGLRVNKLVM